MHLFSDERIESMDYDTLHAIVIQHKPVEKDITIDDLRQLLCSLQRKRLLVLWHDHATILGHGYIMVTIHTVYDPAVYLTEMPKGTASILTTVEEPHLYLIALNSSSIEDQATIIHDRVSCLPDLNESLVTESGIAVHDVLRFFTGDHPAQQFERGTQVGGVYKCGGCGCKSTMMADQAHSLHCKTRTLGDIQTLAVQGVLGKVPGALKPLFIPDLPVNDIQKEAVAKGIAVTGKNRATLQKELQEILQGVQRVPSLLLLQPDESLTYHKHNDAYSSQT